MITNPRVIGYTLTAYHSSQNPADSVPAYYWGALFSNAPTTVQGRQQIYIPRDGTIKAIYLIWQYTNGTAGFNTSLYIRLNNTTDYTVSTTLDFSSTPTILSNTALAIPVVAGDYIELKYTTPAWTPTNPTSLTCSAVIYVE